MPSRTPEQPTGDPPRPDVILDFNCDQGMLFLSLKNIGRRSAYKVATKFDQPLHGLEGRKCISDLQLFRRVDFIPPGKEFIQFLDPVATWFRERRSAKVSVTITYADREGRRYNERITHDLRIYRDLGYTRTTQSGGGNATGKS